MGCCCSTSDEDIYENDATGDTTNLLGNCVGNASQSNSIEKNSSGQPPWGDQPDEQSQLNQILQKTANSYIDVPALNSPVDHPDCKDFEKLYGEKVQEVLKRHQLLEKETPVLSDIPQPELILSGDPLPLSDRNMVDESSSRVSEAIGKVRVEQSESIVIQFPSQ